MYFVFGSSLTYSPAIQLIPGGILCLLIMLFPESPRWLLAHNQPEKALSTLAGLHAHGDTEDVFVRAEYDAIRADVQDEQDNAAKSLIELVKNSSKWKNLAPDLVDL